MTIKYRQDQDLNFLAYCQEEELKQLAFILMYDKDGQPRRASELQQEPAFQTLTGQPDQYRKCWQLIAGELQGFGGDTIVNFFRGNGVLYKEIISDACDKLDIKYDKTASVYDIENQLIADLIARLWVKMSEHEQQQFLQDVNLEQTSSLNNVQAKILQNNLVSYRSSALLAASIIYSFRGAMAELGTASLTSLGLGLIATRAVAVFSGVLAIALTVPLITGSASRVTIPAAIQIAYMRRKFEMKDMF